MNIIKEVDFRKAIKKGLCGGYIFVGEEDYLKSFCIKEAKKIVCSDEAYDFFNYTRLSSDEFKSSDLLSAISATPMMSNSRLVVLDGLDFNKMKELQFESLCKVISQLEDYSSTVLIISVTSGNIAEGNLLKKPTAQMEKLGQYLTVVNFESSTPAKLSAWVKKHFEHNGIEATVELCTKLIDYCGKNMFSLANEIDKLSFYLLYNGKKVLSEQDIYFVSIGCIEYSTFTFSNCIMDGKIEFALDILGDMKKNKIEPVNILGEISKVYTELYSVKKLQESGCSSREISNILKIHEYKVSLLQRAVEKVSIDRLSQIISKVKEADAAIKLSPQGYIAIERLVCSFGGERV